MNTLFNYLWRSPLIRLSVIWFAIAVLGIGVFSWRLTTMRQELILTNRDLQTYLTALNSIDRNSKPEGREEIDRILEEIDNYRPTVDELLNFVKRVEDLANEQKVYLFFHTLDTASTQRVREDDYVSYKLGFTASMDQIQAFLDNFEAMPYAINIQSIDILQEEETDNYTLRMNFILYTKLA